MTYIVVKNVRLSMRNKTFDNLMEELCELHERKNSDYAADDNPYSNFEFAANVVSQFTEPIDQVFACMIAIKLARLGQLLGQGKTPLNESVRDSLRDQTVYTALWTCYHTDRGEVSDNEAFNLSINELPLCQHSTHVEGTLHVCTLQHGHKGHHHFVKRPINP